jgi:hypothetical protein
MLTSALRKIKAELFLPRAARKARARDKAGLPEMDPGCEAIIHEGVTWLGRAQDCSASADGGVARDYSLIKGWATSYPETTGYIIPTMLAYSNEFNAPGAKERATRMLDWIVNIQLRDGGFQGGKIDSHPIVPVTFNTGQILLGLVVGAANVDTRYLEPMHRAATWLVNSQDDDGCWRQYPTPFAAPGLKSYETHVAWGLLEAARVAPKMGYGEAGLANVRWALRQQNDNGWFSHCCLSDPDRPLTHTIGYVLRGILEAWRYSNDSIYLDAARKTADSLLTALKPDGWLPGRLSADWSSAVSWVCLTGSVQNAHCWMMLYQATGELRYLDAARRVNAFVRRTIQLNGPPEVCGAVKGSFPVDGAYGRYEYLNWAVKFAVDANMLERSLTAETD